MRSQVIKVRNLPEWKTQPHSVHVKPVLFLTLMGIFGSLLLITRQGGMIGIGLFLIMVSIFSLLMLPDRLLVQFNPDYMVLYNHRDRSLCSIVYWDEIVTWQYEYHATHDRLALSLLDGTVQSVELFSKRSVARYLEQYAPGKEVKSSRRKD